MLADWHPGLRLTTVVLVPDGLGEVNGRDCSIWAE
jgi:hypothetical protein